MLHGLYHVQSDYKGVANEQPRIASHFAHSNQESISHAEIERCVCTLALLAAGIANSEIMGFTHWTEGVNNPARDKASAQIIGLVLQSSLAGLASSL